VHRRLAFESGRSSRIDGNVIHDSLGELGRDTATIEPLLSTLPHRPSLPPLIVPDREHNSMPSSRQSDGDSSDYAAEQSDVFKAEPGNRLAADYLSEASSWPAATVGPPKYGIICHRDKALMYERPLLTATDN